MQEQRRFSGLKDEEVADIWYALGAAASRHGESFKLLMEHALDELRLRRGTDVMQWLGQRFEKYLK